VGFQRGAAGVVIGVKKERNCRWVGKREKVAVGVGWGGKVEKGTSEPQHRKKVLFKMQKTRTRETPRHLGPEKEKPKRKSRNETNNMRKYYSTRRRKSLPLTCQPKKKTVMKK